MSLGGPQNTGLDTAIDSADAAGIKVVVAAGNSNVDLCGSTSPASAFGSITVGSTTSSDARSSFSNYGQCVDIFAPGTDSKSCAVPLNEFGPTDSFAPIPLLGKWVLILLMMIGRLEVFTVLILFSPAFWKQ